MIALFRLNQVSLTAGLIAIATFPAPAADFNTQVKPILEANCVACHKPGKTEGKLDLTTLAATLKGGSSGEVLKAGAPAESTLFTSTTLSADNDDLMPPAKKGGPLPREITTVLKDWITEGAKWPDGTVLAQRQRIDFVADIQPILELT